MKRLILGIVIGAGLVGCQENESVQSDFTGNETVYALQQASEYDISGTVTFKEKRDGKALVEIALSGTEGNVEFPVHLHLGDITAADKDVAALLNPVLGKTGLSETTLSILADESAVTYKQLIALEACVKIHLGASGPDRDIILAAGNVGSAASTDVSSGRVGIGVCKSE